MQFPYIVNIELGTNLMYWTYTFQLTDCNKWAIALYCPVDTELETLFSSCLIFHPVCYLRAISIGTLKVKTRNFAGISKTCLVYLIYLINKYSMSPTDCRLLNFTVKPLITRKVVKFSRANDAQTTRRYIIVGKM